ncbi:MAG: hypothetical protein ACOYNR_00580 [Blastocatellia bacterium]
MTSQESNQETSPPVSHEPQRPRLGSRRWWRIGVAVAGVVSLSLVAWWALRPPRQESLAQSVPSSAMGYLEVESGTALLGHLTSLKAWPLVSPKGNNRESTWWNRLWPNGVVDWMVKATGETADLLEGRWGLVLMALELRGELVRPHWTLLAEAPRQWGVERGPRLQPLVEQMLGATEERRERYGGVEIVSYHPRESIKTAETGEIGLYIARAEGYWMVSNQSAALRACLDAHLGRVPNLAGEFYWRQARQRIVTTSSASPSLYGYVTADGGTRLLRSGAHLVLSPMESTQSVGETGRLVGALGEAVTAIAPRLFHGIAFAEAHLEGRARTQTLVQLNQDLIDQIAPSLRLGDEPARQLALVPADAIDWTVFRVADPLGTLQSVEAALSARLGLAESFLLHQAVLGVRRTLLDRQSPPVPATSIGDGLVAVTLGATPEERVWLMSTRGGTSALNVPSPDGPQQKGVREVEELARGRLVLPEAAGDPATLLLDDLLLRGGPTVLRGWVDRRNSAGSILATPAWRETPVLADPLPSSPFLVRHYFREDEERERLRAILEQLVNGTKPLEGMTSTGAVRTPLPWAVRGTALLTDGLLVETHSSFGTFPLIAEMGKTLSEAVATGPAGGSSRP